MKTRNGKSGKGPSANGSAQNGSAQNGSATKQTVLVTGAGGYIGCVLVDELLSRGYAVRAMDRFFFGEDVLDRYAPDAGLTLLKTDVRDVTAADLEGVDAVCDLAALSNDPSGDLDPELTRSINHRGRSRVAKAAKEAGAKRYVLSSSCSIYGDGNGERCHEGSQPNPLTTYAESNLNAENDVFELADETFTVTALRNATVFGVSPRMRFDLVVNLMTLHAFEQARITVMGGGKQWRPLVHVRDVARSFANVLAAPAEKVNGEIFNIGAGNFQVRTIAAIVREVLPFPVEIQIAPDDPDRRDYNVVFDKLPEVVGFRPETTIEEGIREIYEALKFGELENSPRCSTVGWYRNIIDAKQLLDTIALNGRIF